LHQARSDAARDQSGFYDTGNASLHYAVRGEGSGMVLFHELGGSMQSWDGVIDSLGARFRVLRFDQRGHGLSEKVRQPFGMRDHADDAMRLIDHLALEGKLWLAGVAAGAAAALDFATRSADRVAGLVLCAPALSVDAVRHAYLEARMELARESGMRAIADESLDRSYPVEDRTDARFDTYRARWVANDPVSYGLANRALIEYALASTDHPCLLLAGTRDALRPPSYVKSLLPLFPDASYDEVDSAHVMPVQAPHALAERIIGFCASAGVRA
jgi:3-oxoadipate enol-lactonase